MLTSILCSFFLRTIVHVVYCIVKHGICRSTYVLLFYYYFYFDIFFDIKVHWSILVRNKVRWVGVNSDMLGLLNMCWDVISLKWMIEGWRVNGLGRWVQVCIKVALYVSVRSPSIEMSIYNRISRQRRRRSRCLLNTNCSILAHILTNLF